MKKICQCCGAELTGSRCAYCGFVEIIDMDGTGNEVVQNMAAVHKKNLVAAITDISIVSYSYKWNEAKSRLELDKKETLKLADGNDCYPGMLWTAQSFGQLAAGKDLTLDISYRFRGVQKQVSCTVPTVQSDDFWQVGLLIDQNLKLKVFLGTKKKNAEAEPVALELQ